MFNKLAIFQLLQITATRSAAGKIQMWLDLDHDGNFSDSFNSSGQNEHVVIHNPVTCRIPTT